MSFKRNGPDGRKSLWRRFRDYADSCLTSGFIPREVIWLQHAGKFLARLWAFIQVGEVRVVGRENLNAAGRLIFCPNHSAMLDAIVVYPIMPFAMRFMSAMEEMRGIWGLKAILMGAMGCYPVDRKNGKTVIGPSINLLVKGKRITLFPEGKISPTGTYLEFKKGAAWIAIGACDALAHKEPVGIVPVQICYGTRDADSAGDFGKMKLRWRAGVTVTFGKPVYVHEVVPPTAEALIGKIKLDITSQTCPTSQLPQ